MLMICLFQSFRKMSPHSYVKGTRLYLTRFTFWVACFFSLSNAKKKTYAFCNTITSLYRTNILYTGFAM